MFQPQPTPYAASFATYGGGLRNLRDDFPDFGFHAQQSLPLFNGDCGGGSGGTGVVVGGPAVHVAGSGPGGGVFGAIFPNTLASFGPPPPVPIPPTNNGGHHATPAAHHPQQHHSALQQQAFKFSSTSTTPSTHTSRNTGSPPHIASIKMECDDLAAQEAAAREYQPDLAGPLVGERTPSDAITNEYAKADQVYVAKTIALPQTYSHYRPIQGDGSCGWRAIGFAYFETLILTATQAKIDAELERITRLNDYIANVGGYSPYIWEPMVEETLGLFNEISARLQDPADALAMLVAKFNDPEVSSAVIFHLRLLAASYLIGHPEYEPFITNGTTKSYCEGTILPTHREIDHVGIMLLVGILLEPAGFVLEIAYLDRTEGSQMNVYRFPESANGQDEPNLGPIIYLLYRPDHYDILYKPTPAPADVQVHRVDIESFSHAAAPGLGTFSAPVDYGVLSFLPGYSQGAPISPLDIPPPPPRSQHAPSLVADTYTPSPQDAPPAWDMQSFPEPLALRPGAPGMPTPAASTPSPPQTHHSPMASATHQLRFSKYSFPTKVPESSVVGDVVNGSEDTQQQQQQHPGGSQCQHQPHGGGGGAFHEQQTMQTTMFKNSHFNVAHFNNPNFQPEEYRPGGNDDDGGGGGSGGGSVGSGSGEGTTTTSTATTTSRRRRREKVVRQDSYTAAE